MTEAQIFAKAHEHLVRRRVGNVELARFIATRRIDSRTERTAFVRYIAGPGREETVTVALGATTASGRPG